MLELVALSFFEKFENLRNLLSSNDTIRELKVNNFN